MWTGRMRSKSDAHTDSRSITNLDSDPDSNSYSDAESESDSHANPDSEPESNSDANSYCRAERDTHTNADSHTNPDQYAWDFERCRSFSHSVHVRTDQLIDFTSSEQRIHELSQFAILHPRYSDRPAS